MFQDIWLLTVAVIFVGINGITMLAWAAQMGYKMKPTAFAYFITAIANIGTGNVVPLSGQSSNLTVSNFVKNTHERVAALLIASAAMVVLGITSSVSSILNWAGQPVVLGMMAGVGLMVAGISFEMMKQDKRTGAVSLTAAMITWWLTAGNPNQLVYVIASSVSISTIDFLFLQKDYVTGYRGRRVNLKNTAIENGFTGEMDEHDIENRPWKKEYWKGFKITKPIFGWKAVFYSLSFICISMGTTIAFGNITAGMADRPNPVDTLTLINGLADIPTVLFGGTPIEPVISATANTNWPVLAGVLMMVLLGFLLLFGFISKLIKYLPGQSIVGFLFIIGFFSTFRPNIVNAFNTALISDGITATLHVSNTSQATVALAITAITKNPFLGLMSGVLVRYIGNFIGLP
jgi:AGZA family xanthine/uracil permease-like MFS transporter